MRLQSPLAAAFVACSQLLLFGSRGVVVDAVPLAIDEAACSATKLSLNVPWPCNRPLPVGAQSSLFVDTRSSCATASGGGLRGYWMWVATVDNNGAETAITDNDSCYMRDCSCHVVCPSCAPKGIYKWKFIDNSFGYYTNVNTGSDFNRIGTYTITEDLPTTVANSTHPGIVVTAQSTHDYSCAHPIKCQKNTTDCESKYKKDETHYFRMYSDVKGRLFVRGGTGYASGATTNATLLPDRAKPSNWVVFKRINETEFFGRYAL